MLNSPLGFQDKSETFCVQGNISQYTYIDLFELIAEFQK